MQSLFNKCTVSGNKCDVSPDRVCHLAPMNKDTLVILESRLPFVKENWLPRLGDEPHSSPLGRHETVTFLMDATFMQLIRSLQKKQRAGFRG